MDLVDCSGAASREERDLQSGLHSAFGEVTDGDFVISACTAPAP